jgi:hypothetical protein
MENLGCLEYDAACAHITGNFLGLSGYRTIFYRRLLYKYPQRDGKVPQMGGNVPFLPTIYQDVSHCDRSANTYRYLCPVFGFLYLSGTEHP